MRREEEGKRIRTNFREKYKRLCKSYHIKYDEEECKEYYLKLKQYGEKKIDRAFDVAKDTIKFFPSITELLEIINNMPPEWFYKKLEVKEPTKEEQEEIDKILNEIGG